MNTTAVPLERAASATRFPTEERRRLLATPGIGEVVVTRLEHAGYASLQALQQAGAERVTEQVRQLVGDVAWRNRRRAIARAIAASLPATGRLA